MSGGQGRDGEGGTGSIVCMGMIDSDTGLLGRGTVVGAGGLALVFREKLPGLAVGL